MMKITPLSTNEPTEPPAYPVCWWIEKIDGDVAYIFKCRTWFDARSEGLRRFGCEVHELKIVQGDPAGVVVDGVRFLMKPPHFSATVKKLTKKKPPKKKKSR